MAGKATTQAAARLLTAHPLAAAHESAPPVGLPACRLRGHAPCRVLRLLLAQTGLGQRHLDGPGDLQDQSGDSAGAWDYQIALTWR